MRRAVAPEQVNLIRSCPLPLDQDPKRSRGWQTVERVPKVCAA